MAAVEELIEGDEVAQRLAHLLSTNGDHVVVHPVGDGLFAVGGHALCDFRLVVREHEIHAAAVDVEGLAEVLASHGRAFHVPARETVAPRRRPTHDVLGLSFLPKGEVDGVMLLFLTAQLARGVEHLLEVASREDAVGVLLIIFLNVEIDRAVLHVGVAVVENLLDHGNLLDDVT